jgi:cyclopropane-fatty-acyl-phospholipid synthase
MMNKLSNEEQILYQLLSLIEDGYLTIVNHKGEEFYFGKEGTSPHLRLIIKDPKAYGHILTFASLGFGESYMYGWWDEQNDNLAELAGLLLSNGVYSKASGQASLVLKIISQRLLTLPNIVANSVKNVQHHYDIGNDFYQLFLDKSLTYSCGYQLQENDTLEEMQTQKYELICKKLDLKLEDNIIDIGCGWGGMLIYAAEKYGISGTGVTLSQEQATLAIKRIEKRGLSDRLKIKVSDYREIEGQFDKFVSIGMFEHVGKGNFSIFMKKVSELLKSDGIGLLHTIGTVGRGGRDPWIEKYIFPGGYLPKLHDLAQEMYKARLFVAHCDNLKPHYAKTLKLWSNNFRKNKDEIMALSEKYDIQFMRTWDLYLQVCEATFLYGNSQLYQILFYKGKQWPLKTPLDLQVSKLSTDIWES